jgi:hydrogenase large subunit
VHAIASVRAVEDALKYRIPPNAQLVRNLMIAAQYVQDHVMHFYHLHALDWVDVVSALDADPKKTSALAQSISSYANSSPGHFARVRERVKGFVESGQLGIFTNGYWGHPAYKLPAEANLMALAHYLDALAWQRDVARLHAVFGGKNPHPNFIVGGVPCAISVSPGAGGASVPPGTESATSVNLGGLALVQEVIARMRGFVDEVYLPDVLAIASFYKDWAGQGEGLGNFMTYGEFPGAAGGAPLIPAGVILDRNLSTIHPVDLHARDQIQEFVAHSWYDYSSGKESGLHPYDGETRLNYSGPKPPYQHLDTAESYSWLKSPRWKGKAVEVGPLARVLMLYANGHAQTRELVDGTLKTLGVPVTALYSTLGRTAARALETKVIADAMQGWQDALMANIKAGDVKTFNEALWDPSSWPAEAQGAGLMEAPRGALGHWIVIRDGKIANYQAIVPSTWNAGPRDASGQEGAYEAALKGQRLADPERPIEILRTIHSFDPCVACAVHLAGPGGGKALEINVV